ncbi:putative ABC transport system permease protein [Ilumatobacter fluminis]|uniref:Putative ABC transport system permease protein n=1 Tax=Ilumatobacter fluminis TaxID=467091 RepID=A0A4R7HUH8_9ACTN|nr:FtsX-like permease family protein [Ilumatobacter fluminis]TDT14572.1 putative ABC transport system permease protein [Ilumatobacter fluminis]
MLRLSIRSLLAKKLRFITTAVAIVLGVAFTAGTMILADTMSASFGTAIEGVADGVDVVARGHRLDPDDPLTARAEIPFDTLDTIADLPGVAAAAPYSEGYTEVIGADGSTIDVMQSVGLNWIDDDVLALYEIVDGRAPSASGEVALGDNTAELADVAIGDPVDLLTVRGRETFTVVGFTQLSGGSAFGNTGFVHFTDADADGRITEPGQTDWVIARGDGSVTPDALAASASLVLPDQNIVTGQGMIDEQQADVDRAVDLIRTILLVFGFIALFVGAFTIANTFTVTIAQRTKELALVRAIGAGRRQVLGSVVIEAAVLGVVAAAAGVVAGIGVAAGLIQLFATFGLEFPDSDLVIATRTIVWSMATGVGVTIGSALLPARRGASVAPVEAMREASTEAPGVPIRRTVVGLVAAVAGVAFLIVGGSDGNAKTVGYGIALAFVGALALGPVLVRPVVAALAVPLGWFGASGRLAAANARRNSKRSAATASALTIGVMLVAGAAMFASTASETVRGDVEEVFVADRIVRSLGMSPGMPTELAVALADIDGVDVLPMQTADVSIDGDIATVSGLDLADADGFLDVEVLDGAIDATSLAVGDQLAADQGWSVGDSVDITFTDGTSEQLPIGAILDEGAALEPIVAPYDLVAAHGIGLDRLLFIDAGDDAAIAAVEAVTDQMPTATVETVSELSAAIAGTFDTLLTIVLGFLGLAIVIAVLGIATTIGLSVHERTRELGVLRAVGMSRSQLRRSIRLEAIVIALFGTAVGAALGIGGTWALLTTLGDDGFASPVLPIGPLVGTAIGAILAGTAAAALPAHRAARRPVLDAIRAD